MTTVLAIQVRLLSYFLVVLSDGWRGRTEPTGDLFVPHNRVFFYHCPVLQLFKDKGFSESDMQDFLKKLEYRPVLTAHPTEARRREIRAKLQRIFNLYEEWDSGLRQVWTTTCSPVNNTYCITSACVCAHFSFFFGHFQPWGGKISHVFSLSFEHFLNRSAFWWSRDDDRAWQCREWLKLDRKCTRKLRVYG